MRLKLATLSLAVAVSACNSNNLTMPDGQPKSVLGTIVTDNSGNIWSLGNHREVLENGIQVISVNAIGELFRGFATKLVLQDGHIFVLGYDDTKWWVWDGIRFTFVGDSI